MRGDELTPWLVRYAYARAAFPMTMDDGNIEWFQPRKRALFPIEGIHVSHTLAHTIRKGTFEVRFDTSFEQVMRSCLRPTDNWISEEFIRCYTQIHIEGWGHCSECWFEGELVGGVYGIAIGSCFCAESMFHRKTDASKVALRAMVEKCQELGFTIFDAQIMNPHLKSLGAYEIPNRAYERLLAKALNETTDWSNCRIPRIDVKLRLEIQMNPELDGRGGGYGKFAGKTIGEIREIYDRCESDPSMRSVSIVLRVAREQLDARGNLGHYPVFAGVAIAVLLATFAIRPFLPTAMQDALPKLQIGLGFVTVALSIGVFATSDDRKASVAQERAIIALSREALEKIIANPDFTPNPSTSPRI